MLGVRWCGKGGYRELLVTAFPLILSTGTWSLQTFIDRMFLAWYSPQAIAASMPASLLQFTIMSVFLGTCGYAGTFVAQYYGANLHSRIGKVVWQRVPRGKLIFASYDGCSGSGYRAEYNFSSTSQDSAFFSW